MWFKTYDESTYGVLGNRDSEGQDTAQRAHQFRAMAKVQD
jgi:hypothetical protein